jgi:hypothetical protein
MAKEMVAKHPQTQYHKRMQWRVTSVLIVVAALFFLLYVPEIVLHPLTTRIGMLGSFLIRAGISLPLAYAGRLLIFSQDHLPTGRSKASYFFRYYYASSYAVVMYDIPSRKAMQMWFDYFNAWADPTHPNHDYMSRTFERTYSLRLIFYLKRVLTLFLMAAIIATALDQYVLHSNDSATLVAPRIFGLVVVACFLAILYHDNRAWLTAHPGSYCDKYDASGAYRKYKDIQEILITKFEEDVLKHYPGQSESAVHPNK